MNKHDFFETENYTGNHLHVDNWKDELTPCRGDSMGKK